MNYIFYIFVLIYTVKISTSEVLPIKCKTSFDPIAIANCSGLNLDNLPASLIHVNDHANVKKLIFSHNKLSSNISFNNWESLVSLDLSYNYINTITVNNFISLRRLKFLNLSYNNITAISSNAFDSLLVLEMLDLSGNPLLGMRPDELRESLAPILFRGLKKFTMTSSNISKISIGLFENALELQYLDLSNNNLTDIPRLPKSLIYFKASNNYIKTIDIVPFQKTLLLKDIFLENNLPLRDINVDAFESLYNLRNLSLDGCKNLDQLPAHLFYFNKKLNHVSLANCNFKTLPYTFRSIFAPSLSSSPPPRLELHNNPWDCNATIKWFVNMESSKDDYIRCASPVNSTVVEYFGSNLRISILRRLLVGLVFVVFILFGLAVYVSFTMERRRKDELPYLRLQGKAPLGNRVYHTTVV